MALYSAIMNLSTDEANTTAEDALLSDPRSIVRLRILRAARLLMVEQGLSVSMEEIAAAADMGRRTVFRYFSSHEELLGAALASALDWYDRQVIEETKSDQPLEAWLLELVSKLHRLHRAAGRGLWQLAASDDTNLPPALAEVNQRRRRERRRTTEAIARAAWRRADGVGSCPQTVIDACALSISSFATHSMVNDFGRTTAEVAESSATMLAAVIRQQIHQQRLQGSDSTKASAVRQKPGRSTGPVAARRKVR